VNFVGTPHSTAENQLLIAMTSDATLSLQQRQYALAALTEQHDPAVVSFMQALFPKTKPGTPEHQMVASFLIDTTPADRELVVSELGSGDPRLDGNILLGLKNNLGRIKCTPKTVADVQAFWSKTTDPQLKQEAGAWLARVSPELTLVAMLRSKDARQIDAVAFELNDQPVPFDDLIEGLAFAGEYGREKLDNRLSLRLFALVRSRKDEALVERLTAEWLSASPRPGLMRAPTTAYILGTRLESKGELDKAKAVYLAGRAANAKLIAEPRPYGPDRELAGVEVAFRAVLASVAVKQKNLPEAKALAANLWNDFSEHSDGWTVINNYSVGTRVDPVELDKKLK
jgi:hypothetical protein